MANWDRNLVLDRAAQTNDAQDLPILLPATGALSALSLRIAMTNGATSGLERIQDAVDAIEVVAGSDRLFRLSGVEAEAFAHFFHRRPQAEIRDESAAAVQSAVFTIPFGRWIGDMEYWLDLANFRRVEVRVEYSPTISATAFATGTFEITLVAHEYRQGQLPPGRLGWLRTTQIKDFTSLAAGEEITELSRDNPLYDLMIYAREAAIDEGVNITEVELRMDNRRYIPYTGIWTHLQEENHQMFSLDTLREMRAFRADTDVLSLHVARPRGISLIPEFTQSDGAGLVTTYIDQVLGDQIRLSHSVLADAAAATHVTVDGTDIPFYIRSSGVGVAHSVLIPFGTVMNDPAMSLMLPEFGRAELALDQGNAGAVVRISTRELMRA